MATLKIPSIKLNNGKFMPSIGLGTYLSKENDGVQAVKYAIDAGYRHIDTAYYYENEKDVGDAVREKIIEGVVKREEMFIVTKLWNTFHEPHLVEEACKRSLENLNLDYIDLYLMHMPIGYKYQDSFEYNKLVPKDENGNIIGNDVDYIDTWKEMEKLQLRGVVRSIGVSNFNSQQIERLISVANIKPVTNQVECCPNLNQLKLIKFCKERDVVVTAYSPLGRPHYAKIVSNGPQSALHHDTVKEIATKYNKTAAQVILKFLIQNGTVPIPKSGNKDRITENINIFDFVLNDDDMNLMNSLNKNERMCSFPLTTSHKYYPFHIEF